jgi:hypothetical protein
MSRKFRIVVLSDIHYAAEAERARGNDFEHRGIGRPVLRSLMRFYRHFVWLRHPLSQNHLLDQFLAGAGLPDCVVANGDYSCDSAFLGVSDDAACASVRECLGRLRDRFGHRFHAVLGDHELGKVSLAGHLGGMRLASFHRARGELGLEPFWRLQAGRYVLVGLASSLVALPLFEPDTLPEEREEWKRLREEHLAMIREAFAGLDADQRVLLFCHDPSALPMLANEEAVRRHLGQIEQTIIGHLHSNLILWKSRVLAGMPTIGFLGGSVRRMSGALREARQWKPFRVRLCPSLAGLECLKDGGYLSVELEPDGSQPPLCRLHPIRR